MYRQKLFFETELELEVLNFWNWNGTVGTFNFGSELELDISSMRAFTLIVGIIVSKNALNILFHLGTLYI